MREFLNIITSVCFCLLSYKSHTHSIQVPNHQRYNWVLNPGHFKEGGLTLELQVDLQNYECFVLPFFLKVVAGVSTWNHWCESWDPLIPLYSWMRPYLGISSSCFTSYFVWNIEHLMEDLFLQSLPLWCNLNLSKYIFPLCIILTGPLRLICWYQFLGLLLASPFLRLIAVKTYL